jgi:hypothetical protein
MVRLQTLDLRIGVRVPASQPRIPKNFLTFATHKGLRNFLPLLVLALPAPRREDLSIAAPLA